MPQDLYYHEQNALTIYNWVGDNPLLGVGKITELHYIAPLDKWCKNKDNLMTLCLYSAKRIQMEKVLEESHYKYEYENEINLTGYWPSVNTIDFEIVHLLSKAEELKDLIDDTK